MHLASHTRTHILASSACMSLGLYRSADAPNRCGRALRRVHDCVCNLPLRLQHATSPFLHFLSLTHTLGAHTCVTQSIRSVKVFTLLSTEVTINV